MLFFYIRHGDPIYDPDQLTPLGHRQAEAVAKRLALYGIDKIYASTSNRAIQTAQPTCEILKKEMTQLDFANEHYAWRDFSSVDENGDQRWLFLQQKYIRLFTEPSMRELGLRWYEHPDLRDQHFEVGMERIRRESDAFFASHGYEKVEGCGLYKITHPNNDRIAMFAHGGFGLLFLSHILSIPYPEFCTHFDMAHSCMTVINFAETNGYAVPKILTYSSDSHLYRDGLPTNYNNVLRF